MSAEMVRVRVLFLKPGDRVHPSEFDEGINDFSMKADRSLWGEDLADMGVYKISSSDLADSLYISTDHFSGMISSPNDPVVEMLVPTWIMYFDLLSFNSDWAGDGFLDWNIESTSVWETFSAFVPTLLEHAKTLKTSHEDGFGAKVQFLTMWECSTWQDYWGEWDCDHQLLGTFNERDIPVRPFSKNESNDKSTNAAGDVGAADTDVRPSDADGSPCVQGAL